MGWKNCMDADSYTKTLRPPTYLFGLYCLSLCALWKEICLRWIRQWIEVFLRHYIFIIQTTWNRLMLKLGTMSARMVSWAHGVLRHLKCCEHYEMEHMSNIHMLWMCMVLACFATSSSLGNFLFKAILCQNTILCCWAKDVTFQIQVGNRGWEDYCSVARIRILTNGLNGMKFFKNLIEEYFELWC
jgi:hypothetical protein